MTTEYDRIMRQYNVPQGVLTQD